jgi:hypothetical protein
MIASNSGIPSRYTSVNDLVEVQAALARDVAQEAVRLFLAYASRLPACAAVLGPLVQCMGRSATGRLIDAIASAPCFYCKDGYTTCEDCAGKGVVDGQRACSICLATGLYPCDFCNASGLVTINLVPSDIRLAVVLVRTLRAKAQAEQLLSESTPERTADAYLTATPLLLKLNRLKGAAESVMIASTESIPRQLTNERHVVQVVHLCRGLAKRIDRRIEQVVALLSADTSCRGTFYRGSLSSRVVGTWLDHPRIGLPGGGMCRG